MKWLLLTSLTMTLISPGTSRSTSSRIILLVDSCLRSEQNSLLLRAAQKAVNEILVENSTETIQMDFCQAEMQFARQIVEISANLGLFSREDQDHEHDVCFNWAFLFLTPPRDKLTEYLKSLIPRPMMTVSESFDLVGLHAGIDLLRKLRWQRTALITDTSDSANDFRRLATDDNVCITKELIGHSDEKAIKSWLKSNESSGKKVFVVDAGGDLIRTILLTISSINDHEREWIFIVEKETLEELTEMLGNGEEMYLIAKDYNKVRNSGIKDADQLQDQRVFNVFEAINDLHHNLTSINCSVNTNSSNGVVRQDWINSLSEIPRYRVLYKSSDETSAKEVGEHHHGSFNFENDSFPQLNSFWFNEIPCTSCQCINPVSKVKIHSNYGFQLTPLTTSVLTVSTLGIIVSLILALYFFCKSFSEVVDGSQSFSVMILVILCFCFGGIVAFACSPSNLICQVRIYLPPVLLAFLFSATLARSLMLATADSDGLPGHISGLIQTSLFLALSGPQTALTIQEILLRNTNYVTVVTIERFELFECKRDDIGFERRMIYPSLLILLQLLSSPFLCSSRRNYKEGLRLAISGIIDAFIVGIWIFLVHLFHEQLHLITILGLLVIPSGILLVVFFPKCYLMTNSFVGPPSRIMLPEVTVSLQKIAEMEHMSDPSLSCSQIEEIGATNEVNESRINPKFRSKHIMSSDLNQQEPYESISGASHLHAGQRQYDKKSRSGQSVFMTQGSVNHGFEDNNYATFKLDKNAVIDKSMKWESSSSHPGK